jgi:hypothetical protein
MDTILWPGCARLLFAYYISDVLFIIGISLFQNVAILIKIVTEPLFRSSPIRLELPIIASSLHQPPSPSGPRRLAEVRRAFGPIPSEAWSQEEPGWLVKAKLWLQVTGGLPTNCGAPVAAHLTTT